MAPPARRSSGPPANWGRSKSTGTFDASSAERSKALPRSPSHLVYLIRQHSRLLELNLIALIDKEHMQPSHLAALKASQASLDTLWLAILPRSDAAYSCASDATRVSTSPSCRRCHFGLGCWRADCPYSHPSPAAGAHFVAMHGQLGPGPESAHVSLASAPPAGNACRCENFPPTDQTSAAEPIAVESTESGTSMLGRLEVVRMPPHGEEEAVEVSQRPEAAEDFQPGTLVHTWDGASDDDPDLAEAVAMSLQHSSLVMPARVPRGPGHQGRHAFLQQGVRYTGRADGRGQGSPISPPLCGDCSPPSSWPPRFSPGCCSRCHARVDILFWPGVS